MTHEHRYSPEGYCEEQTDDGICGERLPVPSVIELEELEEIIGDAVNDSLARNPYVSIRTHDLQALVDTARAAHHDRELLAEYDAILPRTTVVLTEIANALKGPPEEGTSHSWHDLAELATELRERRLP